MIEKDLSPARVAAFSDGVIAIIITIMVLELHVPADHSPHGLAILWPTLCSYALSYVLVAVYWVNHHHLFSMVRRVDMFILWSNIALLFFLSLIPFATAYVGQSRMSPFPVFCYSVLMLLSASCYRVLSIAIARHHFRDEQSAAVYGAARRKNTFALAMNLLAVVSAFRLPALSMAAVSFIALLYFVPGSWIE